MSEKNESLDLNLLRVFLAIWDLRSLTAAGERLGLTQPAVSHALRRLRDRFDDPLFVRAANRMLPTDAAVRLHEPFDKAFAIINRALQERAAFDPRVTERNFRVAMSDVAEFYSLPRLMAQLTRAAPLTQVNVIPLMPDTIVGAMRSGEVDLAIGYIKNTYKECISLDVFKDKFVCIVRKGHPVCRSKLTMSNFVSLRYFYATMSAPIVHQIIEKWFVDRNLSQKIAVRGHFTLAPEIVVDSDLAAIYPASLSDQLSDVDFVLMDLPFELPSIDVQVHSHVRFASDVGIRWMRETAAQILRI